MSWTILFKKTIIWPWGQRSRSHEGHYGTRHTALWSGTTYQISLTYLDRQKCYGPDKKILFKKTIIWPRGQRSMSHEGHYGMWHTALWSCTHIPNKYYLKNNYLTLRSKVKVPRRSLRYATHRLMVRHHISNIIDLSRKTKMLWPGQENTI